MTYQLTNTNCILHIEDNTFIPADPDNRHYREYLDWVAAGNMPLPMPIVEPPAPLTTEQKLEAAGLTVAELKALFGLT